MKTLYAFDIEYDYEDAPVPSLPSRMKFRVEEDFDAANDLPDLITEETGQLVLGCSFSWTH